MQDLVTSAQPAAIQQPSAEQHTRQQFTSRPSPGRRSSRSSSSSDSSSISGMAPVRVSVGAVAGTVVATVNAATVR